MAITSPFYLGEGVSFDKNLSVGYYGKEHLMKIKGFTNWTHFIVHYLVKCNYDEQGNLFYNCERRSKL